MIVLYTQNTVYYYLLILCAGVFFAQPWTEGSLQWFYLL